MEHQDAYRVLTDDDVARVLKMDDAIVKIEDAMREKAEGGLVAPPRFEVSAGKRTMVFTVGAATKREKVAGFRVYDRQESTASEQIVVVFDSDSGALKGIVIGDLIGAMRTGAIGGVAVKHMSRADSKVLGVIGSGLQARTQVEAAAIVRQFETVRVFSRNAEHREAFAGEMSERLNLKIEPVTSAEEAVREVDVLICATTSRRPVFKAQWLKPGVHITTLGPKFKIVHEIEVDVAAKSRVIATDSVAYRVPFLFFHLPFFLKDTPHEKRMVELSDIVVGKKPGRTSPQDITLFCSVGLAGTEVVVANEAIKRWHAPIR